MTRIKHLKLHAISATAPAQNSQSALGQAIQQMQETESSI
jgi:hypothetical protein